ncbi:MAG: hypothetical protein DRJ26_00335 [Candidatus Methanomethylicota archaeon]|uniref:MEMO1 family protein DRJ26_00335 n=1 Tax=Thermoproteota archaeon TaxID=2056631 RepID=A0A497F9F6_9CREN|nr:MAG: hypothetical protein DRJ26_00335 [Candidatus Verstraetearchaeota archaeon]
MSIVKVRSPAVAGMFYESHPESLKRRIDWCFTHNLGPGSIPEVSDGPRSIVGLVCPHAGYMYSGPVAAWSYHALARDGKPECFVILGPNHTGVGAAVSIMTSGRWRTPLGDVEVDSDLAESILKYAEVVEEDFYAHLSEHSIEVQLPFLQYLYGEVKFVPICMMLQNYDVASKVGQAIARAAADRDVVVIASTDFTHYEPQQIALENDEAVIRRILELDPEGVFEGVYRRNVSMCGPGPVVSMLVACRQLGASRALKLKYATSGDITGDYIAVVGYASIAIYR